LTGETSVLTGKVEESLRAPVGRTQPLKKGITKQEAAMAQEQTKRGGGGGDDDDVTGTTAAGQERREKLAEDTDDLLDEIDDVLEENAEDFVRAYVQKGGQ
jgi:ubiquitin-like protein Pup